MRAKKDMKHFYGGRGNKSTSETKHDTNHLYCAVGVRNKIHDDGITVVGGV